MSEPSPAALAWARLSLNMPTITRIARLARAVADLAGDSAPRIRAAAEALETDLRTLLNLGCPVPGGFDPHADPREILGVRRG